MTEHSESSRAKQRNTAPIATRTMEEIVLQRKSLSIQMPIGIEKGMTAANFVSGRGTNSLERVGKRALLTSYRPPVDEELYSC